MDEARTVKVMDTPVFPQVFKPTGRGQGRNLKDLRNTTDISWIFVSLSMMFDPEGNRTVSHGSGKDNLLFKSKGESYISYADSAVAVIGKPQHINERFTVVAGKKE